MVFGSFVQALDFCGWIADVLVLQDALRPREIGVLIEVAAVENHQINVFADVALGSDAIGGGALRAVLNDLAKLGFVERFALLRETFIEMLEHAVFKGFFAERAEDG